VALQRDNRPIIRLSGLYLLDNEAAHQFLAAQHVLDDLIDHNKQYYQDNDMTKGWRTNLTPSENATFDYNLGLIEAVSKEMDRTAPYARGYFGVWAKDKDTRDTALLLGVFSPILLVIIAIVVVFIPIAGLDRRKKLRSQ
jgi:hypothetical protein